MEERDQRNMKGRLVRKGSREFVRTNGVLRLKEGIRVKEEVNGNR